MTINLSKQYTTRNGLPVKLFHIVTDTDQNYPILGAIYKNNNWTSYSWTSRGFHVLTEDDNTNPLDLVEVCEDSTSPDKWLINLPLSVLNSFDLPVHQPSEFESICLKLCTIPDDNEQSIMNSNVPFLCIVTDYRFSNELTFLIMKPYVCYIEDYACEYQIGYGWLDRSLNWVDNLFQPVHGLDYDDRKVIGFIKL